MAHLSDHTLAKVHDFDSLPFKFGIFDRALPYSPGKVEDIFVIASGEAGHLIARMFGDFEGALRPFLGSRRLLIMETATTAELHVQAILLAMMTSTERREPSELHVFRNLAIRNLDEPSNGPAISRHR